MIVLKSQRIDLARPARSVVHCMQTDNTQKIDVSLFVNNRPYDVTADVASGDTVTMAVAYILPNGFGDQYAVTALGETAVEQDDTVKHIYHVMIDGACTDIVGFVQIIVKFTTDGGQILNSFPLTLDVIKSRPDDVDPDGGSPATSRYLRKDLQTPATEDMTQPVGVTPEGLLVTAPGGGGGGGTVNPVGMGFAYSTSSTAQATSPKTTGTVSGFALKQYAVVVVRFSYAVNSGQKLNFSGTGAKDIYFRNSAIGPGIIEAGDTVTFQYDGTRYRIISIDKAPVSQTDDSNYFIHLTASPGGGGDMLTDRTASDIYTALSANTDLNFILIDGSGRQAHFTKKPTSANDSAQFTLVANGNQITFTLPTNGGNTVTITTESIIGGGGTATWESILPDGGIPASDMAQAVQTALTAAGTAVQPSALAAYIPKAAQANAENFPSALVIAPAGVDSNGAIKSPVAVYGTVTRSGSAGHYTYSANISAVALYQIQQLYPHMRAFLVDHEGRECTLIKPPASDQDSLVFYTLDKANKKIVYYTVATSGATTVVEDAYNGGGEGGGTPTWEDILPEGGIPLSDISNQGSANASKILGIGSDGSVVLEPDAKILAMQKSGSTYTYTGANFPFTTLADLQALVSAGTILWLVNTTTGSAYQSVNSRGASSTARLTFAGPTLEADNDDLTVEAFIFDGQMNITRKELTAGGSGSAIPTPTASDNGKYLGIVNGAYALRSVPSGGVTIYSVDIVYDTGYWYIRHDGSDIAAEDIFTALNGGALVQVVDDGGAECELMAISYSPGTGRLVYKSSNVDNGVPEWRVFTIQDEIVQGAPRADVTVNQVDLLPLSGSRTASQAASGFTVDGNTVYAISGTISGFKLTTSTLPSMFPGQCIEIRLTVGSAAITTPTWPSWAKLMNGWDGNFDADTYYDIIIDDAGNVFHSTREVTA